MIHVGIVDDHEILIDGLSNILSSVDDISVITTATNGNDIATKEILSTLDVVILDIEMPVIDGIELSKKILDLVPNQKILILSMYNDHSLVKNLKEIGVYGILSKNKAQDEIINAIYSVHNNFPVFPLPKKQEVAYKDDTIASQPSNIKLLSKREKEILIQITFGNTNKEIGKNLNISARTVDTHRTKIMKKLGASNVASLVRIALEQKIVE